MKYTTALPLLLSSGIAAILATACQTSKPGPGTSETGPSVTEAPPFKRVAPTETPAPNWSSMDPAVCRTSAHADVSNLGMCSAQGMRDIPDRAVALKAEFGTAASLREGEKKVAGTAAIDLRYRWPKGSALRVAFRDDPYKLQNKVIALANRWHTLGGANLTFVKAASWKDSDIRITFEGEGYWSLIGTYAKRPQYKNAVTMSLSFEGKPPEDELRRVTLHEFGHAIGLIHEHKSPMSDIKWDRTAVLRYYMSPPNCWSEAQVVQQVLTRESGPHLAATDFDPESIMAYGVHKSLTTNGQGIPWNTDLSPMDCKFIATQYPQ